MSSPSRIQAARERVRLARYTIGAAAGAAFLGLALVARAAHPGSAGGGGFSPASDVQAQAPATDDSSSFYGDGGSYLAPSQGAYPTLRSGGS